MNMLKLNQEQIQSFEKHGFLRLGNFINNETIKKFHCNLLSKIEIILKLYNINLDVYKYDDINLLIRDIVKIDRKIFLY